MSRRAGVYWAVPAALSALLAVLSLRSTGQIRYEELAESVRNVWWLQNRTLYDPVSSNIAWYGALLGSYRIFGFWLGAAKVLRVALQLGSLYALAAVLARWLGYARAFAPLLVFGLSPTFLTLDTLQASFGVDPQVVPIVLWLVVSATSRPSSGPLRHGAPWLVAMLGWLSFPTMVFSLPSLALTHALRLRAASVASIVRVAGAAAVAFTLPFLASLLYLRDPSLLLKGAFRGGGHDFSPTRALFEYNLGANLADLFSRGSSYHFQLEYPDLSGILPALSLAFAFVLALVGAWRSRRLRWPFVISLLPFVLAFVVVDCSGGPPGARRTTAWLLSAYAVYALAWKGAAFASWPDRIAVALLVILPLHHAAVFAPNFIHISDPTPWGEEWFSHGPNPAASLERYVVEAQTTGLTLRCERLGSCRYAEIYAAVAAACFYRKLTCKPILAIDPRSRASIRVTTLLWETYAWAH